MILKTWVFADPWENFEEGHDFLLLQKNLHEKFAYHFQGSKALWSPSGRPHGTWVKNPDLEQH